MQDSRGIGQGADFGEAMRFQASLEFLIVASSLVALCAAALVFYMGSPALAAIKSFASYNSPTQQAYNGVYSPEGIPEVSWSLGGGFEKGVEGTFYVVFYGCAQEGVKLYLNSGSGSLADSSYRINFSGPYILQGHFTPYNQGTFAINATYSILCGGSSYGNSMIIRGYAAGSGGGGGASFSVMGLSQNVSAYYPAPSAGGGMYYTAEGSHCTYYDFWDQAESVAQQCGTSDAWDYMVFSNYCYADKGIISKVYCAQKSGGYGIASNSTAVNYSYRLSLSVETQRGVINTTIVSGEENASVYLGDSIVGSAYSRMSSPPPGFYAIAGDGEEYILSQTSYSSFLSAERYASGLLAYYNSTEATSGESAQIQEAIGSEGDMYQKAVSGLGATGRYCRIEGNRSLCYGMKNASFAIYISLPEGFGSINGSSAYSGSEVYVNAG